MGAEHLIKGLGEVLQEVKAVGDLRGLGRARTGAIAIGFHPVSGDDGDLRMRA